MTVRSLENERLLQMFEQKAAEVLFAETADEVAVAVGAMLAVVLAVPVKKAEVEFAKYAGLLAELEIEAEASELGLTAAVRKAEVETLAESNGLMLATALDDAGAVVETLMYWTELTLKRTLDEVTEAVIASLVEAMELIPVAVLMPADDGAAVDEFDDSIKLALATRLDALPRREVSDALALIVG